jgi:hypothetical protein
MAIACLARGLSRIFRAAPAGRAASFLLALAGLAMGLLAFSTDPTHQAAPATVHGSIHDAAFAVLGVTLLVSLVVFGFVFRREKEWRVNAVVSWVTAALTLPSFIMKGFVFYFFLAAVLVWCEAAAFQVLRSVRGMDERARERYRADRKR